MTFWRLVEPVHQGQKLGNDTFLDITHDLLPFWGDGIDLIQKDDAWTFLGRLLEYLAQMGLALSIKLVNDLRAADGEKVGLRLMGDGPGYKRFSATRGAVKKDPLWVHRFPIA